MDIELDFEKQGYRVTEDEEVNQNNEENLQI
jgi:hypothetical protein